MMNVFLCLCSVCAILADDPYRPQIHLTAPAGWINDPNGLSYRSGEWHFFCQYNPYGTMPCWETDRTSWYHFVSKDLLHWQPLGIAIGPDACGVAASGSSVTDVRNTAGFGTNAHVLVYTALSGPSKHRLGKQCLAYSTDGRTYRKYAGNPVLPAVDGGADRDPRVFWYEDHWVMALYAERGKNRVFDVFVSPNLRDWTLSSEIVTGPNEGMKGWLFECPGLERLKIEGETNTAWVVWGADAREVQIGDFDGRTFTPRGPRQPSGVRQAHQWVFYAAQAFADAPDGRCIWMAWLQNPDRRPNGWLFSQSAGIPEELTLRRTSDGLVVVRRPIREFAALRDGAAVPLGQFDGEFAEVSLACTVAKGGKVSFDLRGLVLTYDAATGTLSDGRNAFPWPAPGGRFAVTVFLDRGCAEVFSADGTAVMPIPGRPSDSSKRKLAVKESRGVTAAEFKVWPLKSIWQI